MAAKIPVFCQTCFHEAQQGKIEVTTIPVLHVPYSDDNLYDCKCPNGHRLVFVLQEHKFGILFEIGIRAFIDGYPRECVADVATALERFYEFYLFVAAAKYNIAPDAFDAMWKPLASQSERQLGAFVATYTLMRQRAPALLPDKLVKFRNRVIHRGEIPKEAGVLDYAKVVYEFIANTMGELRQNEGGALNRAIAEQVRRARALAVTRGWLKESENISTYATVATISLAAPTTMAFEEALVALRVRMNRPSPDHAYFRPPNPSV